MAEQFDAGELTAAWGDARAPLAIDRAGRVALLGEFASAALAGREPSRECMLFIAGAISQWLAEGGSLEKDFLRVTAPRGSHHRPEVIWRRLIGDERQDGATMVESVETVNGD